MTDLEFEDLLKKVKAFAIAAHKDQKYGTLPFVKHLEDVYEVACRFSLPQEVQIAAWLHDVVEDTDITVQDIKKEFGDDIALLVYAVTDEPGQNRRERHANTYPKMIAVGSGAIGLKLSDNIANVENCLATNNKLYWMYAKEYNSLKRAIRRPNEYVDMWEHLDKLMSTKRR